MADEPASLGTPVDVSFEGLRTLRAAGVARLELSLHAPTAIQHDWLCRCPGSFAASTAILDATRRLGIEVVIVSRLSRSNFRELPKLPDLLKRQGVGAWLVDWAPGLQGGDPRLGMAVPWALAALDRAARIGLPAYIRGVPSCLLGPFAARALPTSPRTFSEATCSGCSARGSCPGVPSGYLDTHGAEELDPRRVDGATRVVLDRWAQILVDGKDGRIELEPGVADSGG